MVSIADIKWLISAEDPMIMILSETPATLPKTKPAPGYQEGHTYAPQSQVGTFFLHCMYVIVL